MTGRFMKIGPDDVPAGVTERGGGRTADAAAHPGDEHSPNGLDHWLQLVAKPSDRIRLSIARMWTRAEASSVFDALCEPKTSCGRLSRRSSGAGGSVSITSSAAPATWPAPIAARRAVVSTTGPRPVFTRYTPSRIRANAA